MLRVSLVLSAIARSPKYKRGKKNCFSYRRLYKLVILTCKPHFLILYLSRLARLRPHMPSPLPRTTPSIDLEDISSQWPPIADFSSETPAQRDQRLEHEREAKRINDEIDAQIEIEKSERRKRRPDIRIILLGQSLAYITHLHS